MASNRNAIKGITIKIGGDTTELGKALESVNKQSDTLSEELREVNRMLKFDPENTELLAQKQKLLAGQVDNTKEKLEKLKEAERQVQEQFARGEVSEAQVRALRREIIKTEGQLKSYEEQVQEAADGTKKLADNANASSDGFTVMKGAMANLVSTGISAMVSGLSSLVSSLTELPEATREYRTEMGKLTSAYETVGHRTEIAEEAYKRLYGVIGETDQTVEAAQQIALLADSEEDVVQWSDLAAGVVARFGDALQPEAFFEAANETIKLGEATGAYVQLIEGAGGNVDEFNAGLAACTTEAEKQAYMLEYTESVLGDAADIYRETNKEVISANDAMGAWTAVLGEAGATLEPLQTDITNLKTAFVSDLLPGLSSVTDAFRGLISGEEGSAEAVGEAISGLISQILDKVVDLAPTVITAALTLISSLATSIAEMLPDIIMLIVDTLITGIPILIDGALQFLLAIVDAIDQVLPPLVEALPVIVSTLVVGLIEAIPELLEGAVQLLMAIVEAIPILIDALLPEIPTIVDALVEGLLDSIDILVDGAITLMFGILEAIPEITAALFKSAPTIVASLVEGLIELVPKLFTAGLDLMGGLIEGMLEFDYLGAISKVGSGIIEGFEDIFDMHSPSRVMAGLGELLDEGLAVGITDNADAPVNALDKLSDDMLESTDSLNGLTLERRLTHAFDTEATASPTEGISSKLDQIYKAILAGQVIMLDGKALVGSTALRYDNELGQRKVLAERGAL